ncbi:phage tail fiber protein (plasmid) [Burkholderia ambifaria]
MQKINLGTIPDGRDGDTVRSGNVKVNANVDVLAACVALGYSFLADSMTLTAANAGARFGLNMGVDGKQVTLPAASSVPGGACVRLFNVSNPVSIGLQGNDNTQIKVLNKGDWVAYCSDGMSYWHVVERGRMLPDEAVGGALSVGRDLTIGGRMLAPGEVQSASATGFRLVQGEYGGMLRNDGSDVYLLQTKKGDPWGSSNDYRPLSWSLQSGYVKIDSSGSGCYIGSRPTWKGGLVPWDSGNMTRPALFSASGGNTGDLNPNAYEVRLSQTVVCGAGGTVMVTATATLNLGLGVTGACDVLGRIRVADGATVVFDGLDDMATVAGSSDAGYGGRGKIVAMGSAVGLTPGKTYTVQFLLRKNQPVGPLYPLYIQLMGMTA